MGACIQCANRNCFSAFHVTCARERGLELKMRQGVQGGELRAYCEKHSPVSDAFTLIFSLRMLTRVLLAQNFVPPPLMSQSHKKLINNGRQLGGKSAQAYKKSYSQGPPIIPNLVFGKVMDYVANLSLTKKDKFVSAVCRYWSLKREARRGAPLLKRLHLEPWTANASMHNHSDEELAKRINLMRLLREDLEKVRMLTEQIRKREQLKLRRVKALQTFVDEFVFAKERKMRAILADLIKLDKNSFFIAPVSEEFVPGYRLVIKHPMDFGTMGAKLDRGEYKTGAQFADDVNLIITNAKTFNAATFSVHKQAVKIQLAADPMLAELRAMDGTESTVGLFEQHMDEVLSTEVVEELFAYDFDPNAVYDEPVVSTVDVDEVQAAARYAAAVKAAAAPKVDRWEGKNRPGRKRKSELLAIEEARKNAPPRAVIDRLRRVSANPNPGAIQPVADFATPQKPTPATAPVPIISATPVVTYTPNPHQPFDSTAGPSSTPASVPKEKKAPQLGEDGKPKRASREGRMLPRGAACLACRNRKVRCDSLKPQCGPCQKAGNRYGPCDYVWSLVDKGAESGEDGMTPRVKKPRPSLDSPMVGSPVGAGSPGVVPDQMRRITVVQPRDPAKGLPTASQAISGGDAISANSAQGSFAHQASAVATAPLSQPHPPPQQAAGSSTSAPVPASGVAPPPAKRKPGRPPRAAVDATGSAATNGPMAHSQLDSFGMESIPPEEQSRASRRRTIDSVGQDAHSTSIGSADAHQDKKGRRQSMPSLGLLEEEEAVVPETSQPKATQSSGPTEGLAGTEAPDRVKAEATVAPAPAPAPVRAGGRQTRGSMTGDSPAFMALPYGERWKAKPKEDEAERVAAPTAAGEMDAVEETIPSMSTQDAAEDPPATEDEPMAVEAEDPAPATNVQVVDPTEEQPMQVDDTPEPIPQLDATPDDADGDLDQPDSSGAPSLPATTPTKGGKRGRRGSSAKPNLTAMVREFEDELAALEDEIAVTRDNLEDGTLVWATVKGWQAVPAEYCDPREKSTPDYIKEARPDNWRSDGLQPVLFFDETAKQ